MHPPVPGRRPLGSAVCLGGAILISLVSHAGWAQTTPAAGHTPPDDTPSIKLGAVLFADYTYQQRPLITDADGNQVKSSSFNVTRAYINVTGNLSHIVAFRITPDVVRASLPGTSLDGSLTFRIKYAFAQINLDDWMWKGTWVRLGIQQTPYVDWMEGIYRYRFQGTIFEEREGYVSSSDAGVSFHTAFPKNYGEVHVGFYNGENYNRPDPNNEKGTMIRGTIRPLPMHRLFRGWRVTGFYIADHYVINAERKRAILNTTFEHKYLNIGFDYLDTKDQTSAEPGSGDLHGKGYGIWLAPRLPHAANGSSWELLLRYDHMRPNDEVTPIVAPNTAGTTVPGHGLNERAIAGLAYWFPKQGTVSAALMFDVENVKFSDSTPAKPTQQRLFLHGLISF